MWLALEQLLRAEREVGTWRMLHSKAHCPGSVRRAEPPTPHTCHPPCCFERTFVALRLTLHLTHRPVGSSKSLAAQRFHAVVPLRKTIIHTYLVTKMSAKVIHICYYVSYILLSYPTELFTEQNCRSLSQIYRLSRMEVG